MHATDRIALSTASATAVQIRAAAPRVAGAVTVGLLAIAGLRAIVSPPRPRVVMVHTAAASGGDSAERDAFAQAFARAYLTFDAGKVTVHDQSVDGFLAPGVELDGSVQPASGEAQRVVWTAVAAHASDPPLHHALVVVATALSGQPALRYLAVPVASRDDGALAVDAPPSLVSPPPRDDRPAQSPGDQVGDDGLRAVAIRGLAAYLRASPGDLAADLAPGARSSVPAAAMALVDTQDVTWVAPDAVSVLATVRDGPGATYELSYRLTVTHQERWFITSIDPTADPRGAAL